MPLRGKLPPLVTLPIARPLTLCAWWVGLDGITHYTYASDLALSGERWDYRYGYWDVASWGVAEIDHNLLQFIRDNEFKYKYHGMIQVLFVMNF